MSVGSISSGSFAAMAAGARGQFRADTLRGAFRDTGILDGNLAAGLDALERQARDLTEAGAASMRADLVGTLIDALA